LIGTEEALESISEKLT